MLRLRRVAPDVLATLFAVSGVLHLVRPSGYDALLPPFLPAPGTIIAVSGVAELACALGLVRRARWAPHASAGLLVAVFPGNVWFAIAPEGSRPDWVAAAAWARLPLQLGLIWMALQARRPVDSATPSDQTPNDR